MMTTTATENAALESCIQIVLGRANRGTQRIIVRTEPCRCGCEGSDPWYRRNYSRRVTVNVVERTGLLPTETDVARAAILRGFVILPGKGVTCVENVIYMMPAGSVIDSGWSVSVAN